MKNQTNTIDANKRKGGRPPKDEEDKIVKRWNIGFTKSELQKVTNKADKAGKKEPHYIHDAALSANVSPHISEEQCLQVRKLTGMANNLNQIARRANQGGLPAIANAALKAVDGISELVQRILRGGDLSTASKDQSVSSRAASYKHQNLRSV